MNPGTRNFLRVALRHPGQAAAIVYWFATGRHMRARGRLGTAIARLPFVYARWLKESAALDTAVLAASAPDTDARQVGIAPGCEIGVHLHIGSENAGDALAAIHSVLDQTWPHWRLIITAHAEGAPDLPCDPRIQILAGTHSSADGLAAALDHASTSYLVPLAEGCRLPRETLAAYAACMRSQDCGHLPVLYGDQDEFAANGHRANPWFKPDWDSDMFLAQDYLSAACALPTVPARRANRDGQPAAASAYALLLRLAILAGQDVRHVHRVTASTPADHWRRACPARLAALRDVAAPRLGLDVAEGAFGTARIRWPLPDSLPLVSIIIPTRDHLDLLQPCVEGILRETRYGNFEIVIADNASVEDATAAFLSRIRQDPRVRVVSWPHPYNYSAINNFAVRAAWGEFLCLLNNDTEIIDGAWLDELMRQACRPGIGAVGARLLYPDRSIQHAGVTVGMGDAAGHAHRGLAEHEAGYFAHAQIARGATAVTAACLVVSRALYEAVGGLDEEELQIAYNDVDFCLKLRKAGARNIYAADAIVIHHEGKSRGLDMAPEHRERYMKELATLQRRWDTMRFQDPTHHPVLDRSSERYMTTP